MLYAKNSFPLYLTQQPVCTGDAVPPALILIQTKVSEKKVKKHTKKEHVYCQTAKDPPTVLQCISYESKQATWSHPGAFPCTRLPLILLLLVSPGLPRAMWQALPALNPTGKCLNTVDVVWTGCSSTRRVLKISYCRWQLVPVPDLRNLITASSWCCAQALQGSKTPSTKSWDCATQEPKSAHRSTCSTIKVIPDWEQLCQHKHNQLPWGIVLFQHGRQSSTSCRKRAGFL